MSQQSQVEPSKPDYFPDKIEIPENSWIFTFNSLGYWSRQDKFSRQEELSIQVEAFRLLKRAVTFKNEGIDYRVLFNAMLYFLRYFQRRSYKHYNRFQVEALCIFIASRIQEIHRSIDDILKKGFEIPPNKDWDSKDKIEKLEMNLMGELCYDLIIEHPFDYLRKILQCDMESRFNFDSIQGEARRYIENSIFTQIYLLYSIEFISYCFLCLAFIKKKVQATEPIIKKLKLSLSITKILEFFDIYNKLLIEIIPIRGSLYYTYFDLTDITENRLKFIFKELDNYQEDDKPIFALPQFKSDLKQLQQEQKQKLQSQQIPTPVPTPVNSSNNNNNNTNNNDNNNPQPLFAPQFNNSVKLKIEQTTSIQTINESKIPKAPKFSPLSASLENPSVKEEKLNSNPPKFGSLSTALEKPPFKETVNNNETKNNETIKENEIKSEIKTINSKSAKNLKIMKEMRLSEEEDRKKWHAEKIKPVIAKPTLAKKIISKIPDLNTIKKSVKPPIHKSKSKPALIEKQEKIKKILEEIDFIFKDDDPDEFLN